MQSLEGSHVRWAPILLSLAVLLSEHGEKDVIEQSHHMQVAKPKVVGLAEAANADSSEEEIRATVTAWHVGVGRASRLVRTLLGPYDGYECKEPEAGKFTLAFRCASSDLTGQLCHRPIGQLNICAWQSACIC